MAQPTEQELATNSVRALNSIARQQRGGGRMFTFGGGTVGGAWKWNPTKMTDPATGGLRQRGYEMDPRFYAAGGVGLTGKETISPIPFEQRKKINVVPAGLGGKQEYRAAMGDGDYVEAPQEWRYQTERELGKKGAGFYNPRGERFSGTIMGTGSYGGFGNQEQTSQRSWSNYTGDKPIRGMAGTNFYQDSSVYAPNGTGIPQRGGPRNPEYAASNRAESRARMESSPSLGLGGLGPSDLSTPEEQDYWRSQMNQYYGMTPFARRAQNPASVFRSGLGSARLLGSSIPEFPFAGQY